MKTVATSGALFRRHSDQPLPHHPMRSLKRKKDPEPQQLARAGDLTTGKLFPDSFRTDDDAVLFVSANVMNPVAGRMDRTLLTGNTDWRARVLAQAFGHAGAHVVVSQESFPEYRLAMQERGFTVLTPYEAEQTGTHDRLAEVTRRSQKRRFARLLDNVYFWKRRYTGLTICVDSDRYTVEKHEFRRFSDRSQGGVFHAKTRNPLRYLSEMYYKSSGKVRTDGLQIAFLADKQYPGQYLVAVNVHLESFQETPYRRNQIEEMQRELKRLTAEIDNSKYADAILALGGDMNQDQEGKATRDDPTTHTDLVRVFRDQLGMDTVSEAVRQQETYPGYGMLDGVYARRCGRDAVTDAGVEVTGRICQTGDVTDHAIVCAKLRPKRAAGVARTC